MKKEITESKPLDKIPTLFDLIRDKDTSFKYIGYPWNKGTQNILEMAKKFLETHSIVYAFIDEIDHNGHLFGVNSKDYLSRLKSFDDICTDFLEKILSHENVSLTVFSDHGMADVKGTVNIKNIIESSDLKLEKDFIYFLDSTIARFWVFNSRAKERLTALLESTPGGRLLGSDDIKKYRINFKSNENGDLLYLADSGNVIMPNFFTVLGGTVKAMHGWDPDDESQNSFIFTNQTQMVRDMEDVSKIFYLLRDIIKI